MATAVPCCENKSEIPLLSCYLVFSPVVLVGLPFERLTNGLLRRLEALVLQNFVASNTINGFPSF